jgi:hypothetical protein
MAKSKKNINEYVCKNHCTGGNGIVYFLGFIGAAVYYVQNAVGFWNGVYGILKAVVWPAILVYKLLSL